LQCLARPLSLLASPDAPIARSAFLLTFSASSTLFKVFTATCQDGHLANATVEVNAPVQSPISNPLMTLPHWARNIFWQAPEHAKHGNIKALHCEPLPSGKGWLDHELRQALRVAVPYLAIDNQRFWKSAAVPPPGGVLVSGGRGAGKTALLERCAAAMAEHPACMCHVSRMQCREMAGDKLKKVHIRGHEMDTFCISSEPTFMSMLDTKSVNTFMSVACSTAWSQTAEWSHGPGYYS
jgi:hypothetical protein